MPPSDQYLSPAPEEERSFLDELYSSTPRWLRRGVRAIQDFEISPGNVNEGTGFGLAGTGGVPPRSAVGSTVTRGMPPSPRPPLNLPAQSVEEEARAAAAAGRAAAPPPSQNRSGSVPTDPPKPKMGTGAGAVAETPPRPPAAESPDYYGRVKAVRTPEGKIVFTNVPETHIERGDSWAKYGQGPVSRHQDVVSGSAGTFIGDASKAEMPDPRANLDRSPGWAVRQAYNELSREGKLSMNAVDVMDRRRWEDAETARDAQRELLQAQAQAAIAGEKQKKAQAEMDPYESARIAAEGKYGSEIIQQEAQATARANAVRIYAQIQDRINEVMDTMPAGPQRDEIIARLQQQARDYANIIGGHRIYDPKMDPFAAAVGAIGGAAAAESK